MNHGYLARALVLTDVLPPFFQGRMDCGATYWGRRTTLKKTNTLFVYFLNLRSILLALNEYLLYNEYFKIIYKNTYK